MERARALGFEAVRVASADADPLVRERLDAWLAAGRHGTMGWMEETPERRASPPGLWPEDRATRAAARSVSAEMATGFRGLRQAMWFNAGRDFSGLGRTPEALADIARIEEAWAEALDAHGGPFLFGRDFTLADAMFAPVAGRFLTWRPEVAARSRAYVDAVRAHPLVGRWYDEASAEPDAWRLPAYETADR